MPRLNINCVYLNADYGIRNVQGLDDLASQNGLQRIAAHEVPANNHVLVYIKK